MTNGTCRICGKSIKNNARGANKQHAGKHCREFAEETGYSKHTDYDLIVAYYNPENAPKWAAELMNEFKKTDRIPKQQNQLTEFDQKGESSE